MEPPPPPPPPPEKKTNLNKMYVAIGPRTDVPTEPPPLGSENKFNKNFFLNDNKKYILRNEESVVSTGSTTFEISSCVLFSVALPLIHSCMKLINRVEMHSVI